MIIELTHKEPFPFSNHYENLSKQRYFKKYFVKLLGIPEVQLMRLGADVEADRAYLFNKFHKVEQNYEIEAWEPIESYPRLRSSTKSTASTRHSAEPRTAARNSIRTSHWRLTKES